MTILQGLISVPSTDPDDARRRRLLNILLVGFLVLAILGLVASIGQDPSVVVANLLFIGGATALYFLNRYISGTLASLLFITFLTVLLALSDAPHELVEGRSLLFFALPIIIGSVILPSIASFLVAGFCVATLYVVAYLNPGLSLHAVSITGYFALALVAWLSGRGLEQALHDLRSLNSVLEQRVQERTRELQETLTREQAGARLNQAILQSIADGVIVFDQAGSATVANPAVSGLLERPATQILGAPVGQLLEPAVEAEREQVLALFSSVTVQPAPFNMNWRDKTLSLSVSPLQTGAAETAGSVVVLRDVTREAEISRMKSIIVAMVSHELRTPLNAIQGLAEVLQQGVYGHLSEKQQQTVDRILINTKRLVSMVRDLLDQAQIEAGTLKIDNGLFTPSELVDSVRDIIAEPAQTKGLEFVTTIDESLPATLVGDAARLSQILINLAGNAVKFTETGSVKIRLYPPDSAHWAMEVVDTGPGIPISAEAYIFDPFRQVDSSAGRKYSGIGLGLSIVKRLIGVMNGEIKLSSRIGRGTTFTVMLPIITAS